MKKTRQKTTDMRCDAIDTQPIGDDWNGHMHASELEGDEGDSWEHCDGAICEKGKRTRVGTTSGKHSDIDDESVCDGWVTFSEPVMSYYYPLPGDHPGEHDLGSDAKVLGRHCLPLCAVRVGGTYGLALTGSGMDFSWEICEAF